MLGRTTRLEFIIVTVAFLVLMLCSKPPRPGSAEVEPLGSQLPAPQDTTVVLPEKPTAPIEVNAPGPVQLEAPSSERPDPQTGSDAEETEPRQQVARLATVDARNCTGLKYDSVMQGEVTVRWVWDGQRFAPQKVCVVKGPNGIDTVWGFDQQGNAVLSETETARPSSR